jgi:hypothetical protein
MAQVKETMVRTIVHTTVDDEASVKLVAENLWFSLNIDKLILFHNCQADSRCYCLPSSKSRGDLVNFHTLALFTL